MEMSLGSATFGQSYGVANFGSTMPQANVQEILECAIKFGIKHMDTSPNYMGTEKLIGDYLPQETGLKISTKLSSDAFQNNNILMAKIHQTLLDTSQDRLWAVLIHNPEAFRNSEIEEIRNGVHFLLESGLVTQVGFSAYNEKDVLLAKDAIPELTVFQISENICDQTKYHSQALLDLSKAGNQFFVRSIFLQGLLLMDPLNLPPKVVAAREVLESLATYSKLHSISLLDACIGYAKSIPWATHLIFGVNSVLQLQNILTAFNSEQDLDFEDAPRLDSFLIDPRNWS